MRPADCFVELWRRAQRELARASWGGKETLVQGTVAYRLGDRPIETGDYFWNDGCPRIRLFRPNGVPANAEVPDMVTSPDQDACVLAHEIGHFRSDPDGGRTQATYDAQRRNEPLTRDQKNLILDEERSAWRFGRAELALLGCTEWATFEMHEAASLRGYEDGLAKHPSA